MLLSCSPLGSTRAFRTEALVWSLPSDLNYGTYTFRRAERKLQQLCAARCNRTRVLQKRGFEVTPKSKSKKGRVCIGQTKLDFLRSVAGNTAAIQRTKRSSELNDRIHVKANGTQRCVIMYTSRAAKSGFALAHALADDRANYNGAVQPTHKASLRVAGLHCDLDCACEGDCNSVDSLRSVHLDFPLLPTQHGTFAWPPPPSSPCSAPLHLAPPLPYIPPCQPRSSYSQRWSFCWNIR